jgi:hypothetical protein
MGDVFIPGNAKVIGIKFSPKFLDRWFRSEKFLDRCIEGVPEKYKVKTYGFDINEDSFFIIYATDDAPEGLAPVWVCPQCRRIDVKEIVVKVNQLLGEEAMKF